MKNKFFDALSASMRRQSCLTIRSKIFK